jgi:cytosine/adenosine deaminase-related metal-dependent hydrolase
MSRLLIRNAAVVTVDDKLGDIDGGDILVVDDRIEAVGRHLAVDDAETIDATGMVAIPGLVNTHIHTWEVALRGIGSDWVSARDYFGVMHSNLTHRYEAADNAIATCTAR